MTVTWTSVTSGNASIGSERNAATPAADEQHQQQHDQQRLVERDGDDAPNHCVSAVRFELPQQQHAVADDAIAGLAGRATTRTPFGAARPPFRPRAGRTPGVADLRRRRSCWPSSTNTAFAGTVSDRVGVGQVQG